MSLPRIYIKTIEHRDQRYDTCGDWYFEQTIQDGECLYIKVSRLSDWRYEFLVAVHELIEVLLCRHAGITQKQVDKFDFAYERRRQENNVDEPGDSHRAPYRTQHCLATGVERILAAIMGISWTKYAAALEALSRD